MRKPKAKPRAKPTAPAITYRVLKELLTDREIQIVRLLSLGCSVSEAAAILQISPSTVDNHKHRAMKKLGTNKSALLTRMAIVTGISSLRDRLTDTERRRLRGKSR